MDPATRLTALILLFARAIAADDGDPASELLRARVEQIREDPAAMVGGVHIAARRALPLLYERRQFAPTWTDPAARDDLIREIEESERDGLEPEDYLRSPLAAARQRAEAEGSPLDARVDYDLMLTDALARLLYHLIYGKVDPRDFDPHWNFTREIRNRDPASFLQEMIDSGDLASRIDAEKPDHYIYRGLVAELARCRELAAHGGFPVVPAGAALERGAHGARVAALRARLEASGDLAASATGGEEFDEAIETAVQGFQKSRGLTADGRVGPGTLAALNVPIERTIEQLRINLERGRWLLHDLAERFVIVNVAAFEVYYVRDGQVAWRERAMVGKPYRKTPIFRSDLSYLVFNPTWTVPPGILANDILPAQRRDSSYLAKKGLRVIDSAGRVVPTSSVDWAHATAKNFRYQIRQEPGPDNSLGRVKFMFPNSHSVYLHDTPHRELFEKDARAFSSGCIRVQSPLELAALLLEDDESGWDRAAIDRAVEAGTTRTVTLSQKIPVLLSYWTAWVDVDGRLQLRGDVYGRDPQVAAGLAKSFTVRHRP